MKNVEKDSIVKNQIVNIDDVDLKDEVDGISTKVKIMHSALKNFSSLGYHKTTTKLIAMEADVNEVTIFRIFKSKENLFQETTEYYVQKVDIENEVNKLITDDFTNSIRNISKLYMNYCEANEHIYKIQMNLPDDMKNFTKLKLSKGFYNVLNEYFLELKKRGEIQGNPSIMSMCFLNSMLGAYTIYILSNKTFTNIDLYDMVDEQALQFANYYIRNK